MRYIHAGLELSNDELEKAKREEKQRVLLSGKLLLVLDLDHTLLNSARFAELRQAEHDVLGRIIAARACADAGGSEAEIRKPRARRSRLIHRSSPRTAPRHPRTAPRARKASG